MDGKILEEVQEKVALMEQFAVGILEAFNQQTESNKETQESVATLSKNITELANANDEMKELLETIAEQGIGSGEGGGGVVSGAAVDETQVKKICENFIYTEIDLSRTFKGHTARIFQEVEKRFIKMYPPESEKKKKELPKVIASTVAITILFVVAVWGIISNVKEKPYYQIMVPAGSKIKWKEVNETEPRMIEVGQNYFVPLAHYKNGKYLFYTYTKDGMPVLDSSGKPVTYYIYENEITDRNMTVINLGMPNE